MSESDTGRVPPGAALDRIAALESRMRYTAHGVLSLNRGELDAEWCEQVLEYADTLRAEVDTLRAALDAQPSDRTAGDLLIEAIAEWTPHAESCDVDDCDVCVTMINRLRLAFKVWQNSEHQSASVHARAALDARPPQAPQAWHPIETHDGTPMAVLIAEQGGYVVEAWFSDERQTWWELNSCDDGSPGSDRRVYPTHWQPLPHPPAADARRPGQA